MNKYRVVQFENGKYALELTHSFLWWTWGSGKYKDLKDGYLIREGETYFSDCLSDDKEELLDIAEFSGKKKIITRTPLEKLL